MAPATEITTALLASIVESSDDAIVSKDLNGIVTSWNAAAERLFGYTAAEMIGSPIAILAPPERVAEMTVILNRLRAGERIHHYETQRRRKDGSLVEISLTVSPIRDSTGRVIGASKIARNITEQVELRRRLDLLHREVDHRAKNVLQIVQALLHLTRAASMEQYIAALEGRIRTLAFAHTQIAENQWRGAEIDRLLEEALMPFRASPEQILLSGPRLFLQADAAQALAITIHELATNASKYGALSSPHGSVHLQWEMVADQLRLDWAERGGPPASAPISHGYGMRVIESMLPNQAQGSVELEWRPEGLACAMLIPMTHCSAPAPHAAPVRVSRSAMDPASPAGG
jgi:PAS domain S-box-containing protein